MPTTAHKFLTIAILIQTLLIYPLLVGSAYIRPLAKVFPGIITSLGISELAIA
ncbi:MULTISPECIES: hypothetical protein [unclassified Moorena]|uniref:hypothetical protein n=1 Tax=unclassified Moorena TaxID=2683338 RepID=UPI00140027A2|nr:MULTISPECIES: hypothetical protein [unclassified Moorena]NEO14422.1 hypothetical protein [Moorena sp. SIO3E8]NEQ00834.1 hypothetical protein [Moorena sp. SIO3F7]